MDIYFALWLITHALVVPGGPNKVLETGAGRGKGGTYTTEILFPDYSGGWMSEVKVLAGLVSCCLSLGLAGGRLLPVSFQVFAPCACVQSPFL